MPLSLESVIGSLTQADVASVARQLGRTPRGLLGVVRRSQCGFPQVVLTAPLLVDDAGGGEPKVEVFPTQFWLTCPLLYEAIARLESDGWIERLEARLQEDIPFRSALRRSHRSAASFRLRLVPLAWRQRLQRDPAYRGHWSALAGTGVAGIRVDPEGDASGVKCLHAHYADWVGRGDNPVGAWVAERLAQAGVRERCDDRCPVRCRGERAGEADRGWRTVAAVDVGSHSVRLLVCDAAEPVRTGDHTGGPASAGVRWYEVERAHVGVRLAANWRAGEPLDPEAVERTVGALRRFAQRLRALGVSRTEAVATGVVREAADGAQFVARVREETGIPLRTIGGEEEAALSFRGAVRGMAPPTAPVDVVLLDIGGATTEWVAGTLWPGGTEPPPPRGRARPLYEGTAGSCAFRIEGAGSMPLGAERLTRAFLSGDPPAEEEWRPFMAHLRALWEARGPLSHRRGRAEPREESGGEAAAQGPGRDRVRVPHVLAVGGTATSLAAMDLGLVTYDRSRVHGHRLSRGTVGALVERLRKLSVRERAGLPGLQPERAPVIAAGAAILWVALEYLGAPYVEVSESDLLEGLIWG